MSSLPEPLSARTLKSEEDYWEIVKGSGTVSTRINSQNKNGTVAILIDAGGYDNNNVVPGEVHIGNSIGDNEVVMVYGTGTVNQSLTASVVQIGSSGLKVGALSQPGISTTFLTQSGDTVTVVDGIIVSVA